MKKYRTIFYTVLPIFAVLFMFVIFCNRIVIWRAEQSDIHDCDAYSVPDKKYDCILVLGAGLKPDGTPSHMLEDRLRGAVSLYRKGVSDVIFLSGDNSGEDYDEVTAMERYCLSAGIPQDAIRRDDIGFSTYESAYNATQMGYKDIIVVTQRYHLYRAMYLFDGMGVQAEGFAADYREYFMQSKRELREYAARCKDLLLLAFS